ncbi:MAG: sigma 54-interacting transcriptional regulator [Myxococcales bacterium]|nr:sigma 54-interacting transcriptional regulator [Myxococcales bacterium]
MRARGRGPARSTSRVVAATHRALPRASSSGARFRQDLYYRLAALTVPVPSLRERMEGHPAGRAGPPRRASPAPWLHARRAGAHLSLPSTRGQERPRARQRAPRGGRPRRRPPDRRPDIAAAMARAPAEGPRARSPSSARPRSRRCARGAQAELRESVGRAIADADGNKREPPARPRPQPPRLYRVLERGEVATSRRAAPSSRTAW